MSQSHATPFCSILSLPLTLAAVACGFGAAPAQGQQFPVSQSLELVTDMTVRMRQGANPEVTNTFPAGPITAPLAATNVSLPPGLDDGRANSLVQNRSNANRLSTFLGAGTIYRSSGLAISSQLDPYDLVIRYELTQPLVVRLSSDTIRRENIVPAPLLDYLLEIDVFNDGLIDNTLGSSRWTAVYSLPVGTTEVRLRYGFTATPTLERSSGADTMFSLEFFDGCEINQAYQGCDTGMFGVERFLDGRIRTTNHADPAFLRLLVIGFGSVSAALPSFPELSQPTSAPCIFVPRPEIVVAYPTSGSFAIDLPSPASLITPVEIFLQGIRMRFSGGPDSIQILEAYRVACF